MLPATGFSAIALFLSVVVFAIALFVSWKRCHVVLAQHGKLFLIFSLTTCAIIAMRQWLGIPAGWQYFTFAVLWEEGQKFLASRNAKIPALAVGLIFASAELAVTKANLVFPTQDYFDNITSANFLLVSLLTLPAVGLHALTGEIYGRMVTRAAALPLALCITIHIFFNLLVAPALGGLTE